MPSSSSRQSKSTGRVSKTSSSSCQWLSGLMKRRRSGGSSKSTKGNAVAIEPSSKAPWRIGAEDTPSAKDWWEDDNDATDISGSNCCDENDNDEEVNNKDVYNDDGEEKGDQQKKDDPVYYDERIASGNGNEGRTFKNVGLENWEKSRKRWRVRDAPAVSSVDNENGKVAIKPSDRIRIHKGLKQVQRTFELPVTISLPDVIEIYQDIWYSDA
mmetsp:Transcript_23665/g.27911  ORF Transcript_23665/g.27911 Transcript_23665/m.27911 type:complete len:213 (+) Transcript_23665:44-682(+)|eukprot:CAMPEP_0198264618 /NCGR_PEP_ID=MMETSP1447-20131203/16263_1 /TAXON_ID=420782 /ORGANISM="Chaetoceros dichaeta, Strain CCMP1751" /LENGTH=212 /DNA_ID=CAMNT_0043953617 /DNA_START=44 /DNA_END=682 /DNA_ORIENTATION=-